MKPSQNIGTLLDFAFSLKFNKKFISSFGPYFKAQKLKMIVKLTKKDVNEFQGPHLNVLEMFHIRKNQNGTFLEHLNAAFEN